MVYNVALDIDQVLAFHRVKNFEQGKFFLNKGAILTAMKTHYIYPGAIEFVRLLALKPNVNLTFYSAGKAERNDELITLILNLALPESEYQDLKSKVRVLSREHLVSSIQIDGISKYYYPAFNHLSFSQKDLEKILTEGSVIGDAVLIDDQPRNAAFGQLYNLLKVPVSEMDDYESLLGKMKFYDPLSGTRFLKCMINVSGVPLDDVVKEGRLITIGKNNDWFEIKFVDLNGEVQVENIHLDFEEMYEQLDYFYEKAVKNGSPMGYIADTQVVENICNFVSEFNGKSRKICRKANRICYVAGLLFSALSLAESEKVPLSTALRHYQFKMDAPNFHKIVKDDRFYQLGLEKLREVNPNYEFVTPHHYHKYSQAIISKKEHIYLKMAIENEFDING